MHFNKNESTILLDPLFWLFASELSRKLLASRSHTRGKKIPFSVCEGTRAPGPLILIKVIVPDSEKLASPGNMRSLTCIIYWHSRRGARWPQNIEGKDSSLVKSGLPHPLESWPHGFSLSESRNPMLLPWTGQPKNLYCHGF